MQNILNVLNDILPEITASAMSLRWEIHEHPELGNQEIETTNRLDCFFQEHGILFHRFERLTGGYVVINSHATQTLCFRADIDALPITENTGSPHCSKTSGVMHACGHDMHTAIAAGLAVALSRLREQLKYNILVLFQPAEENNPIGGAKPIIATGLFEKLSVSGILGLHMWPSLAVGEIGIKPGVLMGASDKFSIDIYGKQAHAAEPHKGVDAISIAADVVNALVHKLHREIDPFATCLVTIGELRSFGRYNIICNHVIIEGTIRSISSQAREHIKLRINQLAASIAEVYGGSAKVNICDGYDLVNNDPALTNDFIIHAKSVLGVEKVDDTIQTSLIGEDFSFYSKVLPAAYFFMGCNCKFPLHSDRFLASEEVLPNAIGLVGSYLLKK